MTDEPNQNSDGRSDRARLKIESSVPIQTIGIETNRERTNYSDLPPQNYIHIWWSRKPTPATRLAVLGSVLPDTVDDDTFLRWLGIDPDNKSPELSVAEHVREKRRTKDDREGRVYDHYGYRKAYKNLPNEKEMEKLHAEIRKAWDGELPTILDATAGGGSIPFESVRYELPTIANELNPVASVLLKAVLEHPRVDGDLSGDIRKWGEQINKKARDSLDEFFPSQPGEKPLEYMWAHTMKCPDCELTVPLTPDWWLDKKSGTEGIAVRPYITEKSDQVEFEVVELPNDIHKSEFNPTDGTISRGKGACPRCDYPLEEDDIKHQVESEGLGYQLYALHVEKLNNGKRTFRAPTDTDIAAYEKAENKVDTDPELATLLSTKIPDGKETERTARHGVHEWRDMYSPRQLLVHHTYWEKYEGVKEEIYGEYPDEVADAILTFLAIAADKALDFNSRMATWVPSAAKIGHTFDRHDFSFKWAFAESNLTADGLGYSWVLDSIVEVYEELHELSGHSNAPIQVLQEDARSLPLESQSVEAIVLDPPYYDNVMYAELSDFFYVWLNKYLGDVYPDFFTGDLTEKHAEAVANPAKFKDVAGEEQSPTELARTDFESKITDIFEEMHRVLQDNGVFTLMFMHKKTEAWDTITTGLIEAGFTIKSTQPINTERKESLHQKGKNSAESTILLVAEKRDSEDTGYTLWEDVKRETRQAARKRAQELDEHEAEFAKVDLILSAFGPTLRVFTDYYPVVDDEGNEIRPQVALDEARTAVSNYLVDQYLNQGVREVDPKTEWYILAWLVFEVQRFPYDEARRLAIGVGEDLDELKKSHRMWRKRSGDVVLRPHTDRVQNISKNPDNRSSRKPVDPESLSFPTALDKVHAALHIYNAKGSTEAWNWLEMRNCGTDPEFKATLEALLRVLPHDHEDWEIARDLTAGDTGELLDLNLDADIFKQRKPSTNGDKTQTTLTEHTDE